MLEVIPLPAIYKLNVAKMWCMNVLWLCWTARDTMRVLQLYRRAHCVARHNHQHTSAGRLMLVVTDQTLFHRSCWIVDYIIRSHSLGLATQYLFVTRRNRKIIVTDRKGWRRGGRGARRVIAGVHYRISIDVLFFFLSSGEIGTLYWDCECWCRYW